MPLEGNLKIEGTGKRVLTRIFEAKEMQFKKKPTPYHIIGSFIICPSFGVFRLVNSRQYLAWMLPSVV
jgi:hypothetical protein